MTKPFRGMNGMLTVFAGDFACWAKHNSNLTCLQSCTAAASPSGCSPSPGAPSQAWQARSSPTQRSHCCENNCYIATWGRCAWSHECGWPGTRLKVHPSGQASPLLTCMSTFAMNDCAGFTLIYAKRLRHVYAASLKLPPVAKHAGGLQHKVLQPLVNVLCFSTEALKTSVHSVSVLKA